MHIVGRWRQGDDLVWRPVIEGKVQTADGSWLPTPFLVDTGADRTVLSAETLANLGLAAQSAPHLLGLGGAAEVVRVATAILLPLDDGGQAVFNGTYAGTTEFSALDMSLLGRDITDFFATIVDRPGGVVSLLNQRHSYLIQQI